MQGLQAVGWRCVLEQGPRVQAGCRLDAGWVQVGSPARRRPPDSSSRGNGP